ncbi:MAG: tripartite tricarboxylate transporter substrate binding protein [Pseudomonadota bacterium]
MRTLLAPLWLALALASTSSFAAFPERALHLVVPFGAGSSPDAIARIVATPLAAALGQPVLVENRPGASGTIGTDAVASAKPDGYTMLFASPGPLTILPGTRRPLPYKVSDLAPLTLLTTNAQLLVVPSELPVTDVASLIAYARANPGRTYYASSGVGTVGHLGGELFNAMAGTSMTHVPVRSGVVMEAAAGRVQMVLSSVQDAMPHVRSGRLRALGFSSKTRVKDYPDIPTMSESGLPGFEVTQWFGVLLPAGAPPEATMRLHAEIGKVLRSPEVVAALRNAGTTPAPSTPEAFAQFIAAESQKWGQLVRQLDLKID